MGRLLVKFPTRNRPDKFKAVFERYVRLLSGRHAVRFVVTMDADDPTMNNPAMRQWLDTRPVDLKYRYGASRTKIEAVNADLDGEEADVLLLASDDMVPQVGGYDAAIFEAFKAFPGYFGAVRFWDGLRAPDDPLMTLAVLGWPLYRALGHIYHPDYLSLYADCEQTDICRQLGVLVQDPACIIRHAWTPRPFDALHARNEAQGMYEHDLAVYRRRTAEGFGLQRIKAAMPPAARAEASVVDISRASAIPGWMTPPELLFLAQAACLSRSILELGSWKGRSSRALADHMMPGGGLTCLDHWNGSAGEGPGHLEARESQGDKVYMDFLANMRDHVAAGRVLPLRMNTGNGLQALKDSGAKFDLIFVDASHTYPDVLRDIREALPLLAPKGMICGHDHCQRWPGVVRAVAEAFGGRAKVMERGTIWSWRMPSSH